MVPCPSGSYGVPTNIDYLCQMTDTFSPKYFIPNYTGKFGDKRLARRADEFSNRLTLNPCSSVRQISKAPAEQKAFYRFLNNEKVTEKEIIAEGCERMSKLSEGRHLLCVQDTCEVNLSKHKGRIKSNTGLGASDKSDTGHCFKLHPGLVLDATTLSPLGFSDIKIFHRPEDRPNRIERVYKKQPISEKESYKWISTALKSKELLKNADSITFIEDREGDIYEQFALVPDKNTHLLVRSRTTRNLTNGEKLYQQVDSQPVAGTYTVNLPTDKRKKQYKREAKIELRFKECEVTCPANLKNKGYSSSIALTCISVKEVGDVLNPINWKLLTTHKINNFEEALQIVEWYSARWYIEQLFRILKKQGFGIEETELESGWAIRKLVLLQMPVMLKILQMNIAYSEPEGGQPINEVFDQEQIKILELVNKKIQGKTHKLQNHNNPKNLKWATWIIGRLGGWKGYDSQGPPGVIVLKRGLDRFYYMLEGINLYGDVGTP